MIAMQEIALLEFAEYSDSLEPLMEELENNNMWIQQERTVVEKYFGETKGVVFVYRVLSYTNS